MNDLDTSKTAFKEKLKNNVISVCIIDDMADEITKQIEEKIYCSISEMDIKKLNFIIHNYGINYFQDSYDILFFDATYEDSREDIQAISLAEKLMALDSAYCSDSVKILLGKDIIDYTGLEDFSSRHLIQRVKCLPYILYGDKYGTKTERMISQIKTIGKRKGINVLDKQQEESCNPKLLKKIEPYITSISENIDKQKKLANKLHKDFAEYESSNAKERIILNSIENIIKIFYKNMHELSQHYASLNVLYHTEQQGTQNINQPLQQEENIKE